MHSEKSAVCSFADSARIPRNGADDASGNSNASETSFEGALAERSGHNVSEENPSQD